MRAPRSFAIVVISASFALFLFIGPVGEFKSDISIARFEEAVVFLEFLLGISTLLMAVLLLRFVTSLLGRTGFAASAAPPAESLELFRPGRAAT